MYFASVAVVAAEVPGVHLDAWQCRIHEIVVTKIAIRRLEMKRREGPRAALNSLQRAEEARKETKMKNNWM